MKLCLCPMTNGQMASLAVVAEKHREQEEALRLAGNVSGLGVGAAALLIEMASVEIKHTRLLLAACVQTLELWQGAAPDPASLTHAREWLAKTKD